MLGVATAIIGRTAGRPNPRRPAATERQHLYLVLPDTKDGVAFHKVDMDDDLDGDTAAESGALERLPEPPVLRIEHQNMRDFSAMGRNIIGMGFGTRWSRNDEGRDKGDTLTFDTRTAALAIMPDLPEGVRDHPVEVAVPVGNLLYVIEGGSPLVRPWEDGDKFCMGLHCLKLDEQEDDAGNKDRWRWWEDLSGYSSRRWLWSSHPEMLPLSGFGIRAHALHPVGRAFFVSVNCNYVRGDRGRGTFSYNTAHYDAGLRAWVGLHEDAEGWRPDGYLCSCDVPRLGRCAGAAPGWKLGKEKLFLEDPAERHVGAKLVDMGGDGTFCLVEIVMLDADGEKCVLRLTTFRVKYGDDDGELTTTDRRPTRSIGATLIGKHSGCEHPMQRQDLLAIGGPTCPLV
ncbi:hypothetical protein C2845_PM03G15410 [Panicum miliaceum]|uniref:DUF1618 domain-containing protein n=1 Tax=Panicum miliaceum TaxID=4540 RepID=A0A3L6T701_PANMI|nr:hypothetical protein C2845_PM03G15410 [Panicum miliaceum]